MGGNIVGQMKLEGERSLGKGEGEVGVDLRMGCPNMTSCCFCNFIIMELTLNLWGVNFLKMTDEESFFSKFFISILCFLIYFFLENGFLFK